MGCGASKSPPIEASRVEPAVLVNKKTTSPLQDSNSVKNSRSAEPSDENTNPVNKVTFDLSAIEKSRQQLPSSSFPPPSTPHPRARLLPRQLSRIDEANSESSSVPTSSSQIVQEPKPIEVQRNGTVQCDSIACQTEFNKTSVMTQTDPLPTPEEELEMLINCEYNFPENFRPSFDSGQGSSIINGFTSPSGTINTVTQRPTDSNPVSLVIPMNPSQKRASLAELFEDFEISKKSVTAESRLVDVAIQVVQIQVSCSTQTEFLPSKPDSGAKQLSLNPLKIEEIETELNTGSKLFHYRSSIPRAGDKARLKTDDQRTLVHLNGEEVNPHVGSTEVKCHDFESQTDPVSEALAANAGDNDLSVLQSYLLSSPFTHIEKQLRTPPSIGPTDGPNSIHRDSIMNNNPRESKDINHRPPQNPEANSNEEIKLQECLSKLLDDIGGDSFNLISIPRKGKQKHASVQTVNDPITDEAPEYTARPPPSRKKEMIPSIALFEQIDAKAIKAPETECSSLISLVNYLINDTPNDLFKVRSIFRWIAHNISYNWNCMGISASSEEILKTREGVCKDYCQLFGDMCLLASIRVKKLQGFAKGYDYRPGHQFVPGEDITHNWNSVFILGSWRFIDLTWGTGYTDHAGKFQRKLNEHFFLTDPETMIWTHFPYNELEDNYSRWQLLDKSLTLEDFNALPKVTPYFFEFNLKIRSKLGNPISFRVQTEIKIGGHEAMRYKYKLYPADEVENGSLNHYVFCQLKEDRLVGSFQVNPPIEGRYFLKIYAQPEKDMAEWNIDATSATTSSGQLNLQSNLHCVVTFLLECSRARKYLQPYPLNELPWGPTQSFYNYKMRLLNQNGPLVTTWGGKRRLILESSEPMLITYQVLDVEGMEMDAKNLLIREDNGNRITFIISPPRLGMFKLMIFGMPKPKQKGKWRLPLLATFLIECKMAKITKLPPEEEDPPPIVVDYVEPPIEYNRDLYRQKFTPSRSVIR